jgi:hypothetical protein
VYGAAVRPAAVMLERSRGKQLTHSPRACIDVAPIPCMIFGRMKLRCSASSSGLSWGLSGMSQPDGLTQGKPGGFPTLVADFRLRRMIQNHNRNSTIYRIVGMSHIPKLLVGVASNLGDLVGLHT